MSTISQKIDKFIGNATIILILAILVFGVWAWWNSIVQFNAEINSVDVGQLWEYNVRNPYEREINSVLVLSKKEGYVEYKVVFTNEVRNDSIWNFCQRYNKVEANEIK